MKKEERKYPIIEQAFDVKYEFTTEEIKAISDKCFYKNKDLKEIKRTFRALAKM